MKGNLLRKLVVVMLMSGLLLTGCSGNSTSEAADIQEETTGESAGGTEDLSLESTNNDVDVNLTALSSIMVYSEVYNMMTVPDDYLGKSVKMRGEYAGTYYDVTDQYYHYVIIADATACCQQGLEFIWEGEHNYPDDYPELGTEVEVSGVFGSYDELGLTYYYISVEDIEIIG